MINIYDLQNQTVIMLAKDLNCPYKYPEMKYGEIGTKILNREIEYTPELLDSWEKEEVILREERDKEFKEYLYNIGMWLIDQGYVVAEE